MANLATVEVKTGGEYVDLAELADVTFTSGNSYQIQVQNLAYLREGSVGDGFLVNTDKPFTYVASGSDLYIKADDAVVNIGE